MFHGVISGFPGKDIVGSASASTRRRGSGDGGGVNRLRAGWRCGRSTRRTCVSSLGCCGLDASMATTLPVLEFGGDGGGVRFGSGAVEARRSLLGDLGYSSSRNGEAGGVSPRSRLENRRNIDLFLNSDVCGDSVSMVSSVTPLYISSEPMSLAWWIRAAQDSRRRRFLEHKMKVGSSSSNENDGSNGSVPP